MSTITTYSGKAFDPIAPEARKICIADIAHALSLLCRANGHFPTFYSIGQHSLHCMEEATARGYGERVALACLLHDASEAYISDITRPVKRALADYRGIEANLQNAIEGVFLGSPLSEDERRLVREVDDALLYHEFFHHMGEKLFDTEPHLFSKPVFAFEPFEKTEQAFLAAFERLMSLLPISET